MLKTNIIIYFIIYYYRLDSKLRWGEHVKVVLGKMKTQTNALIRITASTWGATFTSARQIYSAVIRPALAYGAAVWHPPQSGRQKGKKRAAPRCQQKL